MFDNKMREDFLWYSYFGITKTDAKQSSEKKFYKAFEKCSDRAYLDMCRTIRFTQSSSSLKGKELENYNKKKSEYKKGVKEKLFKLILSISKNTKLEQFYNEAFDIIISASENRTDLFDKPLTYGQAQKWVNMTIKNMLVMGLWEFPENIENQLHIPIDSYIMDEAKTELNIQKMGSSWSKISNINEYFDYQTKIQEAVEATYPPLVWEHYAWIKHANKTAE